MRLSPPTFIRLASALAATLLLGGCATIPEGLAPVSPFDINRYLGTWYEIARLDHSFERGLIRVTAQYSLGEGGMVKVVNKGYDPEQNKWRRADGRAYFVGPADEGSLKVSFFRPFYGGYNILALDQEHYAWSLVCGPNRSYLWILSRTPELDEAVVSDLVARAKFMGFATEELIFVPQIREGAAEDK